MNANLLNAENSTTLLGGGLQANHLSIGGILAHENKPNIYFQR